jgi:HSP20 family protein
MGRAMASVFQPFQEVVSGLAGQLVSRIRLDVDEDDTAYTVRAEIPGARKEDIQVSAEGNELVLSAEIRPETHGGAGQRTVYSERSYGRASRSFTLPAEVDAQSASAQYRDGILTLVLPKKSALSGTRVPIS